MGLNHMTCKICEKNDSMIYISKETKDNMKITKKEIELK